MKRLTNPFAWMFLASLAAAPCLLPATAGAQTAQTTTDAAIDEALGYIQQGKTQKALESAKAAIAAAPGRVDAHLLYIRLMIESGKRAAVNAEYAKLLETRKDAMSTLLHGRTLEKPEQMEAAFRKSLELDPKFAWAWYCIATLQVQQNKTADAITSLQKAVEVQPAFTQAMESLSTLYLGTGKPDEAIKQLEKVVQLEPNNAEALFQLGSLLGAGGNAQRSAELLERSLKLAPNNVQVQSNLAFMYLKLKKYDESLALYDKVLTAYPDDAAARLNREVVRRVKKGELKFEAVEAMEQAMAATSPADAITRYQKVIAIAPNFEVPYMALGQMYAATQKPADAERSFQKAVELNPQSVEAVRMLAEFYLVNNQVDKAIAALQKAIALQPKAPELHGALGMTYAHGKQFSKAEQSFGKAIALMSPAQAVPMRLARAETLIAQYRYGDAVTDLKEVLRVSPNLIPARAYLGQCYFALEDFDKARVELQAVVKAAPDNEQLKELLKENDARQKEFKEKAKTSMRARQIVVKTRPEAEAVLAELNKGAKFDQLARTKSISPEGADGGDIGFFKKGELNADFEKAVQSLQVGQISGVVQTPAGFHIIQRLN